MSNHWPYIPLLCLIPLLAGLISIPLVTRPVLARVVGVMSLLSTLLLSLGLLISIQDGGALVTQMGGWPAPFGISLVFDSLSGLLLAASAMVALGSYIHSFSVLDPSVERRYFHPLMQLLMFGVNMSFLTGDLFNLFVAFEIMLMASYALMAIGATRKQMSQAYKYVLLNLLVSAVFVMAAGVTYGLFGTLNLADLARLVAEIQADPTRSLPAGFSALAMMLLLVFGLKGAFFPLWFWLPDTYYTCPISIAGLFGGMLTKVGVYAVARTFPLIFAQAPPIGVDPMQTRTIVLAVIGIAAAFTMFLAVLGAVSQHEIRRILSVHVISQVGYMVFGIAVMTGYALAGCVFYMIQHMVVKCSLFLCCGLVEKHTGTDDLDRLGGVLRRDPWLGVLFFIAAMSLVGLPPLSGFFGKLVIIHSGWTQTYWILSILGLATGALTLLSMVKIWSYGFWNPPDAPTAMAPEVVRHSSRSAYAGIVLLVASALFLGFGAQPVYDIAFNAGRQMANPQHYIAAVLGPEAVPQDYRPQDQITEPRFTQAQHDKALFRVIDSRLLGTTRAADTMLPSGDTLLSTRTAEPLANDSLAPAWLGHRPEAKEGVRP
jgi:multicomponent Na+:H+ antiporter subunit D